MTATNGGLAPGSGVNAISVAAELLPRIAHLVAAGLNLAGVAMVLDLQDTNARLQADLDATG